MVNKKIEYRIEKDSLGEKKVNDRLYYGSQTKRSIDNFTAGSVMPIGVIEALCLIKRTAVIINNNSGKISKKIKDLIIRSCDEILDWINDYKILLSIKTPSILDSGKNYVLTDKIIDSYNKVVDNFPLKIFQTGSGTQSNMNINEVIASLANEYINGKRGGKSPVHPNDHVNMSQSSNDSFPTAMHIAITDLCVNKLIPILDILLSEIKDKSTRWQEIIKIGRTHMQDATPLRVGDEWSSFHQQIAFAKDNILYALEKISYIAQGATAVGTGINSPKNFSQDFCSELAKVTPYNFKPAINKFESLSSHDPLVLFSSSINGLAVSLLKIANDIRLLACGPRAGIAELILPSNEPGSSIMPGKVNPTQIEALCMACVKVMGNHSSVIYSGSSGHLQLNVFKPLIVDNIIESINILSNSIEGFIFRCIKDIEINKERVDELLDNSLMLVTILNERIGYDNCAKIAKYAFSNNSSLKEAAVSLKLLTEDEFEKYVDPKKMC
ncbi:MAG TPA: class II fumarate hydratase [Candidatus Megaira endosymbiont of Hartmannula sinica]|nr:class II fumarate hydratase [Candidatus Megaera endosymbiont of Hartmannula sinica]